MRRSGSVNLRKGGFTFIEMMAVIFIVGLIISLVVINIEDDPQEELLVQARKFAALVSFARSQSIVKGRAYGVGIDSEKNAYQFYEFDRRWQGLPDSGESLHRRTVPDKIKIKLLFSDSRRVQASEATDRSGNDQVSSDTDGSNLPDIVITPVGSISNFILDFTSGTVSVRVTPGLDEDIKVEKVSAD